MTNETTMTNDIATTGETTMASNTRVADAVTSVPAAKTSCCSETHVVPSTLPVEASLPVATDCCSSSHSECPTEGQSGAAESAPVDDAALIDALREVIDPELMINIVDLGLVYSINHTDRKVNVDMTLTSPACPAGPQIIMQSKMALEKVPGVDVAEIKLTMSPPWTPARMTDEARDQLGIF